MREKQARKLSDAKHCYTCYLDKHFPCARLNQVAKDIEQ